MRFRIHRLAPAALAVLLLLAAPGRLAPAAGAADGDEKMSLGERKLETLPVPELDWSPPEVGREITREALPSGAILYTYPDHRVPLVEIRFRFRAGTFYEPVELAGLSNMALNLIRTGGTARHDYAEVDAELDFMAADVGIEPDDESCDVTLNVLRKDLEPALALVAEMIREPAFPEERIRFRKEEVKASIRRQNDNPRMAAARQFDELLFGDHPYGRSPEWDRIEKITAADLRDFHARFYVPDNLFIAVAGDISPAEAADALNGAFEGWAPGHPDFPPTPPESPRTEPPAVVLYPRDLTQTAIVYGCPTITRESPDIYAAQVLNYIFGGGGFSSRLAQQVRDRAGLAYSVRSSLPTGRKDPAPLTVSCQTKTETTVKALELMRAIMADLAAEPVPPAEFEAARGALANGFVRGFATREAVVSALMSLEFDGRPADFYQTYLDRIRAVTPDQVRALAQRLFDPQRMVTVMVGDVGEMGPDLTGMGRVETRELPEPDFD